MENFLSFEEIMTADDVVTEVLYIEEWGGNVIVKAMSGVERDAFENSTHDGKGNLRLENVRARLAVLVCVKEDGTRLFPTNEAAGPLGKKSASALDKIYEVSQRISGLGADAVDDAEKNSESSQSENSGTD